MQHIDFLAIILRAGVGAWGRGGDTNTINKIHKIKERKCKCKISLQVAMLVAGVSGLGRGGKPDQIPNTNTEYNKEYKK